MTHLAYALAARTFIFIPKRTFTIHVSSANSEFDRLLALAGTFPADKSAWSPFPYAASIRRRAKPHFLRRKTTNVNRLFHANQTFVYSFSPLGRLIVRAPQSIFSLLSLLNAELSSTERIDRGPEASSKASRSRKCVIPRTDACSSPSHCTRAVPEFHLRRNVYGGDFESRLCRANQVVSPGMKITSISLLNTRLKKNSVTILELLIVLTRENCFSNLGERFSRFIDFCGCIGFE